MRVFIILIMLFSFCGNIGFYGDAVAADTGSSSSQLSIPVTVKVENEHDLSLHVLGRLFGDTIFELIGSGNKGIDTSKGFLSGLIVAVLGTLNFCAMVYVAGMVTYMWGIFAVTTAHKGERLGAGVYNSLWIPVRHALSFALTVPIINGFSMMQLGIITCLGFSINFANIIWTYAGNYMLEHTTINVADSAYRNEKEIAYNFLPIIFKNAVVQNVLIDKAKNDQKKKEDYWETTYKPYNEKTDEKNAAYDKRMKTAPGSYYIKYIDAGYDPQNRQGFMYQEYPIDYDGNVDPNGHIIRLDDYVNGRIVLMQRNMKYMSFGSFESLFSMNKKMEFNKRLNPGAVEIGMPAWILKTVNGIHKDNLSHLADNPYDAQFKYGGNVQAAVKRHDYAFVKPDNTEELNRGKAVAEAKVKRVLALWKAVNEEAKYYLNSDASTAGGAAAVQPHKYTAEQAADHLGDSIAKAMETYASGIQSDVAKIAAQMFSKTENGKQKDNKTEKLKAMLAAATDIDNGKSEFGWMAAGLFPFTLAAIQQSVNTQVNADISGYNGTIDNAKTKLSDEVAKDSGLNKPVNENYLFAINNAGDFYINNIVRNNNYAAWHMAKTENATSIANFNDLKDKILNRFSGNTNKRESNAGVLGWALNTLATQNPILAIQNFGMNLFNATLDCVYVTAFISFAASTWALFIACILLLFVGGFFAYVVPFIPVIYWLRALISWVFMVIEAMVAAPIWVCAHAAPQGTGFAGQRGAQGYMMLLDVLARPALLVVGAVFAMVVVQALGYFAAQLFNIWFMSSAKGASISMLGDLVYGIIVMSIMYYLFYVIFTKGVIYMPENVMKWCGAGIVSGLSSDGDEVQQVLVAGQSITKGKQMTTELIGKAPTAGGIQDKLTKMIASK